ncbi:MAG: type II toxin-antitoxin system VapC family toxin [Caldilineaceae bacterium]
MNLLLDTHAFLWAVSDPQRLSAKARVAIQDGDNMVFVSAATAWEIAIKKAIGKLKIPLDSYLDELEVHRFTQLNITAEHALAVEYLPMLHTDPFDRLLIAQAQIEKLVLVTRDARIGEYVIQTIEA